MKRVLLCRTDAIGDLILTLPVARSIKTVSPDLYVAVLVSEYTKPLLYQESYLDEVLTIPGRGLAGFGEVRSLAMQLEEKQFDTTLFFYPRLSLSIAALLAGIETRVGTAYRGYSWMFNKPVKIHRRRSGCHELDLNYELAVDAIPNLPRFEPSLSVADNEIQSARDLLRAGNLSDHKPFVIIHPLSRGSAPNWAPARYLELADRLAELGYPIVLTGSEKEAAIIEAEKSRVVPKIVSLAGLTDLPQLKALIKLSRMVITGSTGPIHIASAVGTYAVGIYPPERELSAIRWGPRGSANKLFVPAVESIGKDRDPMDVIAVDEVLDFILSKLQSDL